MGKLMLIDANALIHRSFHALPPLTTPKGEQVNAVYGYAATLLKAVKDERPDYLVVCYDAGRKTFRDDIYKAYKAKRQETDKALLTQIPRTKDLTAALNIPIYEKLGVEADDLIGSLAKIAAKKGLQTVIVTGDKDTLQLVDEKTTVYSLHRGISNTLVYNRELVKERIGVFPEQVVDFKALAGDASDNIPGVPGIGAKGAGALLDKYGDIEGIYKNLKELPEKLRLKLEEGRDLMEISRRLAKIKTDLKIELNLQEAKTDNFNLFRATSFLREMGFKSLLGKIPILNGKTAEDNSLANEKHLSVTESFETVIVSDLRRWQQLKVKLLSQSCLAIDTKTTDLDDNLIGIGFAASGESAVYLPLKPHLEGLSIKEVSDDLRKILTNPKILKIGHDLKHNLRILRKSGFVVEGPFFDTMLAASLVNSQPYSPRLDDVALSELDFRKTAVSELIGPKKDHPITTVPLKTIAAYYGENVITTWRLHERLKTSLEERQLKRVFYEIEMPLLPVLEAMESHGILIDRKHLEKLSHKLRRRLELIERQVHQLAGQEFNISSPKQLKTILFEKLKLPTNRAKRVQAGFSTAAKTLLKLVDKHPIVPKILEYRELAKLLTTYTETLPKMADKNGRVHTSFQQLGAATGRLSSINPNLQNIPIRSELGNEVRRAFIAPKGFVMLGADYSQAELRVVAHLADDERLIEAFRDNADFHEAVARKLGVGRREAKAINFGIIYGLGPNALADDLKISLNEAKTFIDKYFITFPGVAAYIERTKRQAREDGFVSTLFGRRRYLPDIHSSNTMLRAAAERMAVNLPAQGTVADMMKLAMVKIFKHLSIEAKMLLQIHDELLFEVKKEALIETARLVREIMSDIIELKVPLKIELKSGPNWADLEPLP